MHRFLLFAVVVGSQLATGCCSYGPYLPRLQSGWGCRSGTCGTPILDRPILRPLATVPYYSAAPGIAAPHAGYPTEGYGPASGYPVGGPGCVGCGSGSPAGFTVSAGYPAGPTDGPLPTITPNSFGYPVPSHGLPHSAAPYTDAPGMPYVGYPGIPVGGYPGMPISGPPTVVPGPMPMVMPSAMPGGVPHDSALLKMPTIMPPGPMSESKRPAELARKIMPAK